MAVSEKDDERLGDTKPVDVATRTTEERGPFDGVGEETDEPLLPKGSTVGRYLVLERLGAGAMGIAYAAYDPELDRKIALKLLRPQKGGDEKRPGQARLVREAQAIAKLSHPNVVSIFDVGVHQERVFLAMEYLGGGTLRQWLGAEKRPWRDIVRIFIEAGRGLASAHAEGLIHRDFKPDNVLLDKNGTAKVVDFGLVRLTTLQASASGSEAGRASADAPLPLSATPLEPTALTRSGALTGTPAYMAAEQFIGQEVDARTDQFAFCASLYEALFGERPFRGDTLVALAKSVINGQVRAAREDAGVPGWIYKVLLRGLSVDRANRYPTLAELLETLSHDPVARRRRRIGAATALVAVVVAAVGLQRHFERRRSEIEHRIGAKLAEGRKAFGEARALKDRVQVLRSRAFALFDAHDRDGGERVWTEARATSASLDRAFERAQRALETVVAMDQSRAEARRPLVEAVFERAALAEMELRREDLTRHLATLETVDTTGEQRQRWRQPGTLSVRTLPPGAKVTIERFETGAGPRITTVPGGPGLTSPIAEHALAPGSYRLHIESAGRVPTLYPFLIRRGEPVSVEIPLLPRQEVPEGFEYVPAGRFLYGDQDEELRLSFLNAVPLHERDGAAFLIRTRETTFGEWIEFLSSLPPDERVARLPASKAVQGTVALTQTADGDWKLRLNIANRPLEATRGQPIVYPGRQGSAATQDWLKLPVVGVSPADIRAYLGWFAAARRVPGARLCREAEWERAARGADERAYPSSLLRLAAEDANVDATYGRAVGAYGPDEVGRHPEGRSPFGVDDMAGNVWEVAENDDASNTFVARGGGYYYDLKSARSTNREPLEIELRSPMIGFRVCANSPRQIKGAVNP